MRKWVEVAAIIGMVCLGGCGDGRAPREEASQEPLADSPGSDRLPPGHPPVAASPQGTSPVLQPGGTETAETGLIWEVPAGWTSVTPSSPMRRAQYVVSGEAGDAECVAYYFGPGQGGGADANARRWADQFSQPDGRSSRDVMTTRELEVDGLQVLLVEVTGVYSGGMAMMGGPVQALDDYMLFGAIAEGPDANWFFKFTGPRATVASQRSAFEAMIRSLRPGGSA